MNDALTISIKLYARDGRKIKHKEVKFDPEVTEGEAEAIFQTLVDEAENWDD